MAAEEQDLVGKILLGKIEVLRKLGGGGMGDVYEVEHRLTGHRRALKVVRPEYADRPRFMKRLLREAKVAGTLETSHVVETYDAGRLEDGSAYILMELLHGVTLYDVMLADGRIRPRRLAAIMSQLAEGMHVAHGAGIIHRDLKPENIYLVRDDNDQERVKILDFGVSKFDRKLDEAPTRLTAEGTLVGTPYYMSPEQAAGKPVDPRGDVYAMGVIMYEALSGRLPFEADTIGELFVKIGGGQYVPLDARLPDLDPTWAAIVHRALHKDPSERFQTAEELRRELLPLLQGGHTAARAKTISDGVRATIDYGEPLPSPPRAPREVATLAGSEPPGPRAPSEPPAVVAEPTPEPPVDPRAPAPPRTRAAPAWAWAVGGALAVGLIALPFVLADGAPEAAPDDAPTLADRAHEPEATDVTPAEELAEAEPEVEAPAPEPHVESPAEEPEEPPEEPTVASHPPVRSTPRRRDPRETVSAASSAGLDPNPYR